MIEPPAPAPTCTTTTTTPTPDPRLHFGSFMVFAVSSLGLTGLSLFGPYSLPSVYRQGKEILKLYPSQFRLPSSRLAPASGSLPLRDWRVQSHTQDH